MPLPDTLSTAQQQLILLIYETGFITKKEQDIYRSRFFYNKIGELIRKGLVNASKNYENRQNQYTLTETGLIFVKILRGEKL